MKKYFTVFKNSLSIQFEYRMNFLLGRLRNIVALLLLYYVWHTLTSATGRFAGYSEVQLFTYVFGVNILRAVVFGAQSREMAHEINQGTFSIYLVKPISYFWYNFSREAAQRVVYLFFSIFEVTIFVFLVKPVIFWQMKADILLMFTMSVLISMFLYYVISFLVSAIAFWSREALGPRFLFDWFLEFTSGAYFPLDILSKAIFVTLAWLPFYYLMYFPINIYLGKINFNNILIGLGNQIIWLFIVLGILKIVWQKGLKRYTGEGA